MTPLENYGEVYLKREDKNITGSAKDRAIDIQTNQSIKEAVISSSGNAAISAQYFCNQKNIKLKIFVSPKTNPQKLKLLNNYSVSNQPISDAFKYAKSNHAYNLRQSTDPNSLIGYQEIGKEVLIQCPKVTSIFIPVGSGTTLLGISQVLPSSVKIFAVQPASHCPIASHFDKEYIKEESTITDALSVKSIPLKSKVIKACYSGVVVQNNEVQSQKIDTSPEGNLAYAGYLKAKKLHKLGDYPIILLTGAKR